MPYLLGRPRQRGRSMWPLRRPCMAAALFLAAVLAAAPDTRADTPAATVLAKEDAQALLARIQDAARKLDFAGTVTYQQGEFIQSSRLVHMVDGNGEHERLEVMDGEAREYLRRNDDVQCLIPARKTVLVERRRADRFPGLLLGSPVAVPHYYQVTTEPALRRVAGRQCRVITIQPLDQQRYGYRLCADAQNDLLLKAQTLNGDNAVVEQVTFSALRLGSEVQGTELASKWSTQGWDVVQVDMKPVDLAAKGWRIPLPPGFMQVSQVARNMGQAGTGRGEAVSQLVISDGLAAISIFIEPYDKKRHGQQPQGAYRRGAINVYGTRIADYWLTALGEVPPATLQTLAQATEYVPPAPVTQ